MNFSKSLGIFVIGFSIASTSAFGVEICGSLTETVVPVMNMKMFFLNVVNDSENTSYYVTPDSDALSAQLDNLSGKGAVNACVTGDLNGPGGANGLAATSIRAE